MKKFVAQRCLNHATCQSHYTGTSISCPHDANYWECPIWTYRCAAIAYHSEGKKYIVVFVAKGLCCGEPGNINYSSPEKIVSNRRSNFLLQIMIELSNFLLQIMIELNWVLGIQKLNMTVYCPKSNGLGERFIYRTLTDMLAHTVEGHARDWDLKLPMVLFVNQTAPQESTGLTPFRLLNGMSCWCHPF